MKNRKDYITKLVKCPKCFQLVQLKGYSSTSIKCAMEDLYNKIEYHLDSGCFFRNRSNEKIKIPIFVTISTEENNRLKTEWQDNNFFLL